MTRRRYIEDGEGMALMAWAAVTFYKGEPIANHLVHIPNGGKRNAREAARMKRMGVKPGYPDYLLDIMRQEDSGRWLGGLRIELKAPRERLGRQAYATDLQLEHLNRLTKNGFRSHVCHGWVDAACRCCEYLQLFDAWSRLLGRSA